MKKTLIATLIAGAIAANAHAAFVDESSTNPFSTHTQLRVIGSMQQEPVHGFATGVPLHQAIGQIVPRSYTVQTVGIERMAELPVSWRGGRSWVEVMRDVVEQIPSLKADVDTTSKLITFGVLDGSAAVQMAGAQDASDAPSDVDGSQTPEPMPTWEIRQQDMTIRAVFERWARIAGWQLVWDMDVDYPISAAAAINATFEEAVEKVARSLQQAETPPQAIFYRGNNVLRVIKRGSE